MQLTSKIIAYDPAWPENYLMEASQLVAIFGTDLVNIHHIGSTAIPGISAKPEIDILVEITAGVQPTYSNPLTALGYSRGEQLGKGRWYYRKNQESVRTHKLHVCNSGSAPVRDFILFRDYLRDHPACRKEYQELKLKLESTNTQGIREYLDGKASFIRRVLAAELTR